MRKRKARSPDKFAKIWRNELMATRNERIMKRELRVNLEKRNGPKMDPLRKAPAKIKFNWV